MLSAINTMQALTVIAIFSGPIVAIQIQKLIEKAGESRKAKLDIHKTLMATRGMTLHIEHVRALNLIDIAFSSKKFFSLSHKKDSAVLDAWKMYMEHLYKYPKTNGSLPSDATARWEEGRNVLFIDLMHKMSTALGFSFDKVQIERQSYTPQAYESDETYRLTVQAKILDICNGKAAIPVDITNVPTAPVNPTK